jgi:hypothetical protein
MMLRSLVDEVVRRRLWPIPLVAVLVAIAAPLLFMKSAPTAAPAQPPAPATEVGFPKAAGPYVNPKDKPLNGVRPSPRKAQDPFAPPASSSSSAASGTSAASAATGKTSSAQSVPVVIKNSDGTTSTATIGPSTGTSSTSSSTPKAKTKTKKKSTTPKTTTPTVTVPKTTTSSAAAMSRVTYVDVTFGERMGTMTRFRVPRLQTFRAGGKVAAMFVGYSVTRNAAVFAIAPSTKVSGVKCREVKGVCRYVDLPVGAHARLTLRDEDVDGEKVSRRLDVVGIRHLPKVAGSKASARMTTLPAAKCLLKSLLALSATAPSISTDSCD